MGRPEATGLGVTSYAFGDTQLAAERLELLAEVFEPPSREFLRAASPPEPETALDLGCGTGTTTVLVAETSGADHTVGVDSSEPFLARAAARARPGTEFVRHDVTAMPLPCAPVDLLYARYVLSHLPDPKDQVRAWAGQLRPGGRLLLDEAEYMTTNHPVLQRYEVLVNEVVGARGATLMAGPVVAAVELGDDFRRSFDQVATWPVPEVIAARLYVTNLATWRNDAYVVDNYASGVIDELADDLATVVTSKSDAVVEWGIRQVAFERVS